MRSEAGQWNRRQRSEPLPHPHPNLVLAVNRAQREWLRTPGLQSDRPRGAVSPAAGSSSARCLDPHICEMGMKIVLVAQSYGEEAVTRRRARAERPPNASRWLPRRLPRRPHTLQGG